LWLGSTSWLIWEVWFPAESRFAIVDSGEVARTFFEWNESADLVLLESGRRIGSMKISGSSGEDRDTGLYEEGFSMVVSLDPIAAGKRAPFSRAFLTGNLEFGPERKVKEGQLSLRLPARGLNGQLKIDGEPLQLKVQLKVGELTVYETEGPLIIEPVAATARPTPLQLPENLPFGLSQAAEGIRDGIVEWKPEISARRGKTRLAGRSMPVYLLTLASPDRYELKVWLTEIGEPLRIETGWGLEAVAEVLAPIETLEQSEPEEEGESK
jgi:hypothetical protein